MTENTIAKRPTIAEVNAEANAVYSETSRTPRELANERAELLEALKPFARYACGSDDGKGIPARDCTCHNCNAARIVSKCSAIESAEGDKT